MKTIGYPTWEEANRNAQRGQEVHMRSVDGIAQWVVEGESNLTERRQWSASAGEKRTLRGPFVLRRRDGDMWSIWYEATQTHSTASVADVEALSVPILDKVYTVTSVGQDGGRLLGAPELQYRTDSAEKAGLMYASTQLRNPRLAGSRPGSAADFFTFADDTPEGSPMKVRVEHDRPER